jgi:hypothetical protein
LEALFIIKKHGFAQLDGLLSECDHNMGYSFEARLTPDANWKQKLEWLMNEIITPLTLFQMAWNSEYFSLTN